MTVGVKLPKSLRLPSTTPIQSPPGVDSLQFNYNAPLIWVNLFSEGNQPNEVDQHGEDDRPSEVDPTSKIKYLEVVKAYCGTCTGESQSLISVATLHSQRAEP